MLVHAITWTLVSAEHESPEDEAKEKAKDAAGKKKPANPVHRP